MDSSALLTDSASEVATKTWVSKVSGSKLVLLLDEHEVESSFDEKLSHECKESSSEFEEASALKALGEQFFLVAKDSGSPILGFALWISS